MVVHGFLHDIGISVIVATFVGIVTYKLRQPIILGYLVAGVIIGPEIGPQLVSDPANIEVISEIGLMLLLFIIGLEMNPQTVLASGKPILVAGIGQFLFSVLLGVVYFYLRGYPLGGESLDALYPAIFCGLSSTAIVVKILYDKFELDTLHGRVTLGVLIFQDVWAILVLAIQPSFLNPQLALVGLAVFKSLVLLGAAFLISRYVLRAVMEGISKSPEMVVAASMAWCALVAGVAHQIGLSMEMGALIAGVSISSFPFSIHVTAKVLPLRDFFLTLFFISLGMKIPPPETRFVLPVLEILAFVILSRFAIVYPLLLAAGSGRRTAFITSLNLAQISEFSLVIAVLGLESFHHIPKDVVSLILYAMALTSILSSYFIKYNHEIFSLCARAARAARMGRKPGGHPETDPAAESPDGSPPDRDPKSFPIVVLGFHRGARALIDGIATRRPDLLRKIRVIDFNLEVLKELGSMKIACVLGDISSMDNLKEAHVDQAKIILSTIPDVLLRGTNNLKLVTMCRALSPQAMIVATADFKHQIEPLKQSGANYVVLPYSLAGERLGDFLIERAAELG